MSTIVVAEDDPDILEMVVLNLTRAGHEILPATDGAMALSLVRDRHPHLALLDWMMPELTGIEVCSAIRHDPTLDGVKVVILTALAQKDEVDRGRVTGADDYIIKPFRLGDLRERIADALAAPRSTRAADSSDAEPGVAGV